MAIEFVVGVVEFPTVDYFIRVGKTNIPVSKKAYNTMTSQLSNGSSFIYDDVKKEFYKVNEQLNLFDEKLTSESVDDVEQLYYVVLTDSIKGFLNVRYEDGYREVDTSLQTIAYQTMFTLDEIKAINKDYLPFKRKV